VRITFANTTGHTLDDQWVITVTVLHPVAVKNAAGTNSLIVRNDGNVGIGTMSPGEKLHVAGKISVGSTNDELKISSESGYRLIQSYGGVPLVLNGFGNYVGIGSGGYYEAPLHVNISDVPYPLPSGAAAGFEKNDDLDIYFLSASNKQGRLYFGDGDNKTIGGIIYDHTNNYLALRANSNNSLLIDSNQNTLLGGLTSAISGLTGGIGVKSGNGPSASGTADAVWLWVADAGGQAGKAVLNIQNEDGQGIDTWVSRADVYRSSDQSINSASWTKINLNAENYDTEDEFDNSTNYRFTAKVAGYYSVKGQITFGSMGNNNLIEAAIYKNGTKYRENLVKVADSGLGSNASVAISFDVYLAANDYLELYGYQNSGSAKSALGGNNYTFLSVYRLGK